MPRQTLMTHDPLWVPLLSHYRDDGGIDHDRMKAHLEHIAPHVTQIMLAGSTGDGWEIGNDRLAALVDFAAQEMGAGTRVMMGTLAPGTDDVVARINLVERRLSQDAALAARFVGVTVCPPVEPDADQKRIRAHFEAVFARTSSPVSVYQLPQVTGCSIAPETFSALATNPRVIMFKDSGGNDEVAESVEDCAKVTMLRGAEGGYAKAVSGQGYGGWLLSSANAFGKELRDIEAALRHGDREKATRLSDTLGAMIARLFSAAADEGGANAFSNANRAADHLRAYGKSWKSAPAPYKQNGDRLSESLIAQAAEICAPTIDLAEAGYLHQ